MKKISLNLRSSLAFGFDIITAAVAWCAAYLLRFNFEIPSEHYIVMVQTLWLVLPLQAVSFISFGLYRGIWRYASVLDLKRILLTILTSTIILVVLLFTLNTTINIPRSVLILDPTLLVLMMGGSRFLYRLILERPLYSLKLKQGKPVVIIGTGYTAITLAKELTQSNVWTVVGFLDDDQSLYGREISGFKVLGGFSNLAQHSQQYGFKNLILATSKLKHSDRRTILFSAKELSLEVLTIPSADDLISGRLIVSQIRPVDVLDLLGRDTIKLDNSGLLKMINGSSVFVSGAGGSIGSELCRQILRYKPKELICLDISEQLIYLLEQELKPEFTKTILTFIVGDVKHVSRLDKLFFQHRPKVVFHAAAYKHVPLMENENVSEAFNNNVLGTFILAKASKKWNVDKFILISTDKAVNPTNVMGATKRLAEMVCQGLQDKKSTHFVMVRFGNVLGSSGSVIPKFQQQIAMGGPVTVTHPEITRFFMSIPEAAQLVMQAGFMGKGGEIFVLDMGDPIRILDLAKDMIRLSGFTEEEIKVEFSGLRPGEKLYEELLANDEKTMPTPHEKLRIASARGVEKKWVSALIKWIAVMQKKDEQTIKVELKRWVKEYDATLNSRKI